MEGDVVDGETGMEGKAEDEGDIDMEVDADDGDNGMEGEAEGGYGHGRGYRGRINGHERKCR